MKKLVTSIALIAALGGFGSAAFAAEEGHDLKAQTEHAIAGGHFPILKPQEEKWSFAGPFGKYDKGQLQRGLKVYKEVCSACHAMSLVSFRTLEDLGYSEDQVKAFAAEYEVQDGPNADGEMFTRKETLDLVRAYYQLGERPRRRLLDLAKSLNGETDAA